MPANTEKIGRCKKCGGLVFWDHDTGKCIFNPVSDCLCECPYPKKFMYWWWTNGGCDIEISFEAWQAGRESFMDGIGEIYDEG